MHLLPEDQETVLQPADLGPIRRRVAHLFGKEHGILPYLIDVSILSVPVRPLSSNSSVRDELRVSN